MHGGPAAEICSGPTESNDEISEILRLSHNPRTKTDRGKADCCV
jgi:hypothetical protein